MTIERPTWKLHSPNRLSNREVRLTRLVGSEYPDRYTPPDSQRMSTGTALQNQNRRGIRECQCVGLETYYPLAIHCHRRSLPTNPRGRGKGRGLAPSLPRCHLYCSDIPANVSWPGRIVELPSRFRVDYSYTARRGRDAAPSTAGSNNPTNMLMITMTTNNSTNVKAEDGRRPPLCFAPRPSPLTPTQH